VCVDDVLLCMCACIRVYCFVGRQFAISIHQIAQGFTPPPVQNQYVKQGTGGYRSVVEDATIVVFVVSSDASQPVNLTGWLKRRARRAIREQHELGEYEQICTMPCMWLHCHCRRAICLSLRMPREDSDSKKKLRKFHPGRWRLIGCSPSA